MQNGYAKALHRVYVGEKVYIRLIAQALDKGPERDMTYGIKFRLRYKDQISVPKPKAILTVRVSSRWVTMTGQQKKRIPSCPGSVERIPGQVW